MHQLFVLVFCNIFFFNAIVKSENIFLTALNDIESDIKELIPSENRAKFYSDYYELTDILKGLSFSAVIIVNHFFSFKI